MKRLWLYLLSGFRRLIVFAHVPPILLVRLLRPFVLIRFGWMQSHKIGHLPLEGEYYLCERLAGLQPKSRDFFFDRRRSDGRICNEQAMAMLERSIWISPWIRYFYEANRLIPGGSQHEVHIRARDRYGCRDLDHLFDRFPVQIDFTADEIKRGQLELEALGVPSSAKFICVHVRDSGYWQWRKPEIGNDSDFRNCDVMDFIPAIQSLLALGFYVLRIGYPVSGPLPIDDSRFIDYSRMARSPFMDVFLAAHCHFMVSTGSGIDSISYMFRRPIVMCNLAPVGYLFSDTSRILNLPKLHRRAGESNLLSYREVRKLGADNFILTEQYRAAALEYLDASPDVIRAAVMEMVARLDGSYQETEADKERAKAFWDIYANVPRHPEIRGILSSSFTRAYPHLF